MSELKEHAAAVAEVQLSKEKKELLELDFPLPWLNKITEKRARNVLAEMKRRQRDKEEQARKIVEE
jgi:hypothetical protein